jgi:hypothetical protein
MVEQATTLALVTQTPKSTVRLEQEEMMYLARVGAAAAATTTTVVNLRYPN